MKVPYTTTRYREYRIIHNPKPIPDRRNDFDWFHDEYDGAPDSGDKRCGTAQSIPDAIAQIEDLENEEKAPPYFDIGGSR